MELEQIIAHYIQAKEAGEHAVAEEYLERYPEHFTGLLAFFIEYSKEAREQARLEHEEELDQDRKNRRRRELRRMSA